MSRFEIKIVAALLLIAVIPLAASVFLVGQVIKVSDSVTAGQTRRLAQPLERAAEAYRDLFAARKRAFRLQGELLTRDRQLLRGIRVLPATELLTARLQQLVQQDPELTLAEVLDGGGEPLARARSVASAPTRQVRDLQLTLALPQGQQLRLTYITPRRPFEEFRRLGQAQRNARALSALRDDLATYNRVAFLVMFGAVAVLATGLGLFIARRTTRRVKLLADATRQVAAGDLETRVTLKARDELGYLARSFNEMVRQIKESSERIAYLEKVGAWQEIARRLAHEIKNPLTPIQLAVQQLHRKYDGDDPAFARTLDDAHDIITEEVDGLRRLVQAFSAFAKLPTVQPAPAELGGLVDDFLKSHSDLAERVAISWSPEPEVARQEVLVDRMLIKHVLVNLAENAVHAAEDTGTLAELQIKITARIARGTERAEIAVADNGPGMPPDVLRRVFDPYFTTKDRGTGLGLAIVKKIILEHGGAIQVTSEQGAGTRFVIALPLRPRPAPPKRKRLTGGRRAIKR